MMMKNIYIVLILITGIYADMGYYKVANVSKNDTLSVRTKPSSYSKKITELMPYDTRLQIEKCQMNGQTKWCQVYFMGEDYFTFERGLTGTAWVNVKYLKKAHNVIYTDAENYNENNLFKVVGVASDDLLNVREHPYNSAKKIGRLYPNDIGIRARKCQRVGQSSWCYVVYDYTMAPAMGEGSTLAPFPKMGWVNMRYLKLDTSGKEGRLPFGMMFSGEVY